MLRRVFAVCCGPAGSSSNPSNEGHEKENEDDTTYVGDVGFVSSPGGTSASFWFTGVTPYRPRGDKGAAADEKSAMTGVLCHFPSTALPAPPQDCSVYACRCDPTTTGTSSNGMVGTLMAAYNSHAPLVLRPDDLWVAIVSAFGYYVNTHAEVMRRTFVEHDGKKDLTVTLDAAAAAADIDWPAAVERMTQAMDRDVKGDVLAWITPDFTTTTADDRLVARIVMLSAMQKYFDLSFEYGCGLSRVTLLGTLQDWTRLREKASRIATFGSRELGAWSELLLPVLDRFVDAYQGRVDPEFWQRVASRKFRGSGGQCYYRGWCIVFAPFNALGGYQLNSASTVSLTKSYGCVDDGSVVSYAGSVRVEIKDHHGGSTLESVWLCGGVLGAARCMRSESVGASIGWAVVAAATTDQGQRKEV